MYTVVGQPIVHVTSLDITHTIIHVILLINYVHVERNSSSNSMNSTEIQNEISNIRYYSWLVYMTSLDLPDRQWSSAYNIIRSL